MRTEPVLEDRGRIARLTDLVGLGRPTVAVVPVAGAIISGGRVGRSFDDEQLAPVIERAFRCRELKAVALAINCPGGSAVQSNIIAGRIRRLADEKNVPVVAFCADIAASGGYWLACAADEIYADASSIVGSIGVIAASFGFHDAISRLGVERRVHTSGELKSFWDPFRPERDQDVERLHRLQIAIHRQFVEWVKARRGPRLSGGDELYTGEFWSGEEAQRLGLVDGIGHLAPVMKERYGEKIRFRVFGRKRRLLDRLGMAGVDTLADELVARGQYARFGL